jgi:hypothetical protein
MGVDMLCIEEECEEDTTSERHRTMKRYEAITTIGQNYNIKPQASSALRVRESKNMIKMM